MSALTVGLVQADIVWHCPTANHRLFETHLDRLGAVDVAVLPEMFTTGFTMASREVAESMDGPSVEWMCAQAASRSIHVTGSLVIEDGGQYFNRFVWVSPDGQVVSYDKRHRFRMAGEHEHFDAGANRVVVNLAGWRVCLMVCYDLRFPAWFRSRDDYDAIFAVASWPARRQLAWNTLLRARAIENQCYAVGVNRVGVDGNGVAYRGGSAVYGPSGETLCEAFDRVCTRTVTLDRTVLEAQRVDFPVHLDRDRFELPDER